MFLQKTNTIPADWKIPAAVARLQSEWGFWDGICRVEADPPAGDPPATPPATPPSGDAGLGDNGIKALQTEREQRKQAETQLKTLQAQLRAFEGIDPEKAKEAQKAAERIQEIEAQQAKLRADLEAEYKQKYDPQLEQQRQLATQAQQELQDYKRDVLLERAFIQADGFPDSFRYAALDLQARTRLTDKGAIEVLDAEGNPAYVADNGKSRPMTAAELIQELAEQNHGFARHFKGNDSPGFALKGQGDYSQGNPAMASMPAWERVRLQREGKR